MKRNTPSPIDKKQISQENYVPEHKHCESVPPGGDSKYNGRPTTAHHLFCSPFLPQKEIVGSGTRPLHSDHIIQQLRDEGLLPLRINRGLSYFIPVKEVNGPAKRRMTSRLEPIARGHSDYSLEERHLMADVLRREKLNEMSNRAKLLDERRQRALERRLQRHKELSEKLERKMRDVEERIKRREKSRKKVKNRKIQDMQDMDTNEL